MLNKDLYRLFHSTPERVVVDGSFAPNGSSAISAASNRGNKLWSVAYTSTGLYTITFTDVGAALDTFHATLQLATGDDKFLQVGSYDSSAKTITIRCWDVSGAAVADIAADANNRIHFLAIFRLTTLTP